jgi:hypothetical protein
VAKDSLSVEGVDLKETEQKAIQEQALADFAAKAGIPLEAKTPAPEAPTPTSTPAPAPKTMGPLPE